MNRSKGRFSRLMAFVVTVRKVASSLWDLIGKIWSFLWGNRILTAAMLATLATAFAALAAWFSYQQQYLNFLNSVRPEIYLEEWSFTPSTGEGVSGTIEIGRVQNFGPGLARIVHFELSLGGLDIEEQDDSFIVGKNFLLRPGEGRELNAMGIL